MHREEKGGTHWVLLQLVAKIGFGRFSLLQKTATSVLEWQLKTPQILIRRRSLTLPSELIADFEHAEVDTSHPHAIVIRSPLRKKALTALLPRIDQRCEAIRSRRGHLDDSSTLIREDREREEPRALHD